LLFLLLQGFSLHGVLEEQGAETEAGAGSAGAGRVTEGAGRVTEGAGRVGEGAAQGCGRDLSDAAGLTAQR